MAHIEAAWSMYIHIRTQVILKNRTVQYIALPSQHGKTWHGMATHTITCQTLHTVTCMHAYINTYMHAYMCACIHASIYPSPSVHPSIQPGRHASQVISLVFLYCPLSVLLCSLKSVCTYLCLILNVQIPSTSSRRKEPWTFHNIRICNKTPKYGNFRKWLGNNPNASRTQVSKPSTLKPDSPEPAPKYS